MTDPNTNKQKQRAVFVVFYAGERAKLKITKVCSPLESHEECFVVHWLHAAVKVYVRHAWHSRERGQVLPHACGRPAYDW